MEDKTDRDEKYTLNSSNDDRKNQTPDSSPALEPA